MIKITKSLLDYNIYILSSNLKKTCSKDKIDISSDNLSSYYRAIHTIRDYAKNNKFNFFITITIDSRKCDISNELAIKKKILKYFNNFKNRYDPTFKYILVAERGKKTNRLHFHGLVILNNIDNLVHVGFGKYRDIWLFNNFGANCFIPIYEHSLKVVNYISKYITKDSYLSHIYKFNYFCSNGLKRSKVIYRYDNGSEFCSNNLNSSLVKNLIIWLNENNLLQYFDFCSYSNLSYDYFDNFIKSHNLNKNEVYKQLDFNDITLLKGGATNE